MSKAGRYFDPLLDTSDNSNTDTVTLDRPAEESGLVVRRKPLSSFTDMNKKTGQPDLTTTSDTSPAELYIEQRIGIKLYCPRCFRYWCFTGSRARRYTDCSHCKSIVRIPPIRTTKKQGAVKIK